MLLEALGPKCFVIISIHIKESQEIKKPASRAIQSSYRSVLLASKFIQITLTTNSVTTVAGMERNSFFSSVFSLLILVIILFDIISLILKIICRICNFHYIIKSVNYNYIPLLSNIYSLTICRKFTII